MSTCNYLLWQRLTRGWLLSDRNWLNFLSILDAAVFSAETVTVCRTLFRTLSAQEGRRDRAPMLGLLELEKRARDRNLGITDSGERAQRLMRKLLTYAITIQNRKTASLTS